MFDLEFLSLFLLLSLLELNNIILVKPQKIHNLIYTCDVLLINNNTSGVKELEGDCYGAYVKV